MVMIQVGVSNIETSCFGYYNMKHATLCGPYVITILDWTYMFERYMTTLVVENGHNKTCITTRLDYLLKI